jgi:hypothetical protein
VHTNKPVQLAHYAIMTIVQTLSLAAVVVCSVAFVVMAPVPVSAPGLARDMDGLAGRVTRFVCAYCTSTGNLVVNFPSAACFSTELQSGATLPLQSRVVLYRRASGQF